MTPGGSQHVCDTGVETDGSAICSASGGSNAGASSLALANYGNVSAFVQGGAYFRGYGASATASSSFSDTLTFFGGTGTGILSILESITRYGTGSLQAGNYDWHPSPTVVTESFTYGTPFVLSLSAYASGNFYGGLGDGGSLLVAKSLESLTVLDAKGNPVAGVTYTDASGHSYTSSNALLVNAPEPGAWVMGAIGFGLLWLAKRKIARP
jgi:hypothetical protein